MTDEHHAHDVSSVAVGVLTISSSRDVESDASGDAIVAALEADGHDVPVRDIVADDERGIRRRIDAFAARADVDAVVTTGGTGITEDDVTVEAARALFDRILPGFGEQFRARSVAEAGPHAMLSRATAGVSGTVPIFCLPGSEDAARFGTRELVVPILGHVVGLLAGDDPVHHHDGSETGTDHGGHSHE